MERQPSLESKAMGKNPGPRSASPASVAAPPRTTNKRPRRAGQLAIVSAQLAIVSASAAAPTPPSDNPEYEYEGAEFDMNDDMSESVPSHVSVDFGSKDGDGSVDGGSTKPKRRKGKKGIRVSPKAKAKRGRGKTSKCWQHFTMAKPEGETIEKAKCNYCGDFLVYKAGGQTSSLLRHNELCSDYKDFVKGQMKGQG